MVSVEVDTTKVPFTVFHESLLCTPVKMSTKSFPSGLNHLLEKFQKKMLDEIEGAPNALV